MHEGPLSCVNWSKHCGEMLDVGYAQPGDSDWLVHKNFKRNVHMCLISHRQQGPSEAFVDLQEPEPDSFWSSTYRYKSTALCWREMCALFSLILELLGGICRKWQCSINIRENIVFSPKNLHVVSTVACAVETKIDAKRLLCGFFTWA
jgi:hypothetical protein